MRKNMQKFGIVLLLLVVSVGTSFAQSIHGEVNGGLTYTWDKDEKNLEQSAAITGFRLVLEDDVEPSGQVHFSVKGSVDWKTKKTHLAADQLWYSGYAGDVDFKIGRQVISWGTADGFNPTNYFARLSTDALTDGELGGDPIWAGQATYYGPGWSVTGVAIPFFKPQEIDTQMEELMIKGAAEKTLEEQLMVQQILQAVNATKKPRALGKNTELALRAETQFQGFDVQASVFTGFEPLPGLELVTEPNPNFDSSDPDNPLNPPVIAKVKGEYRRQYFVGLATAGTVGPMGVWGEVTYGGPKPFEKSANPYDQVLSVNKNYLQAVVGGDYTFEVGKGLLAQAQYIYRGQGGLLAPYGQEEEREAAHYLYGRLGYDFSLDSTVDLVLVHGVKEKGGIVRSSYTHRFPNSIQLELSALGVYGKDSDFYNLPSQVRAGVTYKF